MVKLTKYLHRLGHPLMVLTGGFESRDADPSLDQELEGIPIHVANPRPIHASVADYANRANALRWAGRLLRSVLPFPDNRFRYLPAFFSAARQLIDQHGIRTVLITSPPNSMSLLVPLLRVWRKDLMVILDFRDMWALDPQLTPDTAWFRWTQRLLERWTIRQADLVVSCTPGHGVWIRRQLRDPNRSHVITNGYDEEDFHGPLPEPSAGGPFLLTYAGSIGGVNGPHSLRHPLAALRLLEARRPDLAGQIVLQVAGHVAETERRLLADMGAPGRVRLLGFLPHREALAALSASHAILILLFVRPHVDLVYTGKLFEACRLARPLLVCAPPGLLAEFVGQRDLGEVADPLDPEAISLALERLMDRCRQGTPYPLPCADLDHFERSRLARHYANLLFPPAPSGQADPAV